MATVLARLPEGAKVNVIRLRSLGDCVLTTPALSILRGARPDLHITVTVEPRFAAVFEGSTDVDAIAGPGLPASRAELAINLHGGSRSAWITAATIARFRAGFSHFRPGSLYNVKIPRAQEILGEERTVHTAEHLASAMFYLGAPRCEMPRARLFAPPPPKRAPYAVLHPMAALPEKTWPAKRFLETAQWLRREAGLEPLFIGAAGDDLSAFAGYECLRGAPLKSVMSLLSGAALFLGNDSGPAHMAAAFGVPVVVLYGASDPVIWAPWRTASEVLVARDGLAELPVSRVLESLERLRVRA
ncbi:MAG: glycosyltransferase family 9 protein [Bryobacteraceae bacterium]|nr:glycosyltransferase family 9 protein [Bryobacteraceae bacterium]